MKYCSKCGGQLADGVAFCPNCGAKVDAPAQPTHQAAQSATNGFAIAGFVCSFFFILLGLIFGCVGLSKSKQLNGNGKGLAIAAIVISIIKLVSLVALIALAITLGAALIENFPELKESFPYLEDLLYSVE